MELQSQKTIKEIQRLSGLEVALNRFITKSFDKCKSFFQALRIIRDGVWTQVYEDLFKDLKLYLVATSLIDHYCIIGIPLCSYYQAYY